MITEGLFYKTLFYSKRALSKAKTKKDRALQKDLQSEIRNLRKEIRKREVILEKSCFHPARKGLFAVLWRAET